MRKVFPKAHFNHAANPMPDMAHVSPATLIACGLGAPVQYDFSGQNLPDKYDFVGAQHYSKRMSNLLGSVIKQQQQRKLMENEPKSEPVPQPEPQPQQ